MSEKMEQLFGFGYPILGIVGGVALVVGLLFRVWWYKAPTLYYSLTERLAHRASSGVYLHRYMLTGLRTILLLLIGFLMTQPRLIDVTSEITVEGIDILLVLDISGSMRLAEDVHDKRTRWQIAKEEALHFIDKRVNDAMGIVLFANDVITRCPVTLDKTLLKSCMQEIDIGYLQPEGTLLATGIIMAANRLKTSYAKSRVMIVLTDGEPSAGDQDPRLAVEIAKQLGIKIYTIGIGSEKPEYIVHPLFGHVPVPGVNKQLLTDIAQQTGGTFFLASNAQDMRRIYDTIDQLEKTELPAPIFMTYYELLFPLLWIVVALFLCEICLTTLLWFGL